MSPTKPVPESESDRPRPSQPPRTIDDDAPHPDHERSDPTPGRPHPDHKRPDGVPPPTAQPRGRQARDASIPAPALAALLPTSAAIGDPSFMLRVVGSGFTAASVIVFAGVDEPTTFVSDEELTTGVNMDVWLGPDPAIPVLVRTPTDGVPEETATLFFAFTAPRAVPLDEAHASKPIPLMDQI